MLRDRARVRTRLAPDVPRAAPGERAPEARLGLAAAIIGTLFGLAFVASEPIWAGQPQAPPGPTAAGAPGIGWPGAAIALAFALVLCLPFRPYAHALRAAGPGRAVRPGVVVALTALLAGIAVLMYPRFGSDVFDYLGFERMWVVYGDNPLLAVPAAHPQDWSTPLVWFADQPPAYGPLWAVLTWPVVRLGGDSVLGAVLGYKLLALAAYAACCRVIWWSVEPARRAQALVVFGWSPLVLFEVLGKAHNDILVALAAVGALALAQRGNLTSSILAAALGGLVKATTFVLLPVLALRTPGPARGRAAGGALALLAVGVAYAPFWAGLQTLQPLVYQTGRLVWSPATLVVLALGDGAAWPVRIVFGVVWLAIVVWFLRRAAGTHDLAAVAAWVLLAGVLLLSTAVYAHYLVPFVALAAVADDAPLRRASVWLSIGGLAAYSVELLGIALGSDWLGSPGHQLLGSLLITAPAALVLILVWRDRARPHAPTAG